MRLTLWAPLAYFVVVLLGSVMWLAMGGAQSTPVSSAMWGRYAFWQSGVLAAAILATNAAWARRWGLVAFGVVLTLFGAGSEMLALR